MTSAPAEAKCGAATATAAPNASRTPPQCASPTNPANGKSIIISNAGQVTGTALVDEAAGTITFTNTFKGLPEKIQTTHGPVLLRDAGIAVFTDVFDLATGDPISSDVSIKGPHPDLESDFALFCEVITGALN